MARCGCGSTCACKVIADPDCPNVTVSGIGSSSVPYQICVDPTALDVLDTDTVDMTLTGSGTEADPYIVSADVIVAPDTPSVDNLLQATANGLLVSCEDIQDCVGKGFSDGLEYDDVANAFRARLSDDAGNTMAFGSDGGLYSAAGGGGSPAVIVTDGDSVDMSISGAGTAASPFNISAEVKLSGDDCNALEFGTDGALYLGPLDPLSTNPLFSVQAFGGASNSLTDPVATGIGGDLKRTHGSAASATITNPSSCRSMRVLIAARVNGSVDRPAQPNQNIALRVGVEVMATMFYPATGSRATGGLSGLSSFYQEAWTASFVEVKGPLAPGASLTVTAQAVSQCDPTIVAQQGTITDTQATLFLMGVLI